MKTLLFSASITVILFIAVPSEAQAQKRSAARTMIGTIAGFECGDNCYLTIRDSHGKEHEGLCRARLCGAWNEGEGAMPDSYKGRLVSVTVSRGKQYDANYRVMGYTDAFTRMAFIEKYAPYANARFRYQIDYTKDKLKAEPESENGDGRVFKSADGQVELRVWGEYNAPSDSLRERYTGELGQHEWCCIRSKTLLRNGYVISGSDDKTVHYEKTLYRDGRGDTARYANFTITYPRSRKAEFEPIVRHIAASFRMN